MNDNQPVGDPAEITCLQMTTAPTRTGAPSPFRHAALMRAKSPPFHLYQYLRDTLTRALVWSDWIDLDRAELEKIISDPKAELYVAYDDGVPVGFLELDLRSENEPAIAGLGVSPSLPPTVPELYLLEWAIERLWQSGPDRVTTKIVRADHLETLAVLQRAGFEPYDTQPVPASP